MKDRNYSALTAGLARPPWWATAATLAGLALFIGLGAWQLDRAAEKRALLAQSAAEDALDVSTTLPARDAPAEEWLFQQVALTGQYETDRQILLDNMTQDGRVGYQVLTPLRLAHDGSLVLINRGWIEAEGPRAQLPELDVAQTQRRVTGRLNHLPRPGLRLGQDDPGATDDPWPRRFLYPERETLEAALGEALPPFQVQLSAQAPDGFSRQWTLVNMPPERHVGYAVQWFAFAVVLLIIYYLLGMRRGRKDHQD